MGGRYSCHICFIPRVSTHGSEFLLPTSYDFGNRYAIPEAMPKRPGLAWEAIEN
jgi:hypothetical protein